MRDSSVIFIIPAILISCILVFVILCITRVRRLRAADQDDLDRPSVSLYQRRVSRSERPRTARDRRWPHRSRGSDDDVDSGVAAFRLTPISTSLGSRHSISQPTHIATARSTLIPAGSEQISISRARPSPVSAPPLPHTPPPPYNEALRVNESVTASQTWL
jgi:hypothetical protein